MNERWTELFDGYFHDTLSAGEKRELTELLQTDALAAIAFARHAEWAGGIGYAMARLQTPETEHPAVRTPGRFWRPGILALAASTLLVLGLGLYVRLTRPGVTAAILVDVAAVAGRGPATDPAILAAEHPHGRALRAATGTRLAGGSVVTIPEGLRARFLLPDGSSVELGGKSSATFPPPGNPAAVALAAGMLYGNVTPRRAGEKPFVVTLPGGRSATAIGTRFELVTDGAVDTLRVEQGRVRLRTPSAAREAGPLQRLSTDAQGSLSLPEPVPLYAIATWKFEPESVPAGTVLFQDDFEQGLDRWEMPDQPAGRMEIAEGMGPDGGRCLVVHLKTTNLFEALIVYPSVPIRQRDFEFGFRYRVDKPIRGGPVFRVPGAPGKGVTVEPTAPSTVAGDFPRDAWVDYRAVVRGTDVAEFWTHDGRLVQEKNGRINTAFGYFTHVGFGAHRDAKEELDLYMDDVVIRKLEPVPEPAFVPPGTILFQDDFEDGMDRWEALRAPAGRVELAEGGGVAGSRALLLRLEKQTPLIVFPEFDLPCVHFEMTYRSRTVRAGPSAWIRQGAVFRVPTAPSGALTPKMTAPPTYHGFMREGWTEHRIVVKGTDVYETTSQDGRLFLEMHGRFSPLYGFYTRIGLAAYGESKPNELAIDDVVIRTLDRVPQSVLPPGAILFHDDFSAGLERWEALTIHRGEMALGENRGLNGRSCMVFRLRPGERTVAFPKINLASGNVELACRIRVNSDPILFGPAFRAPAHPEGYTTQTDIGSSRLHGTFQPGWAEYRAEVKDGITYQTWRQEGRLIKEKQGQVRTDAGPFTQVGLIGHIEGATSELCISDVTIRKLGD